MTSEEIKKKTTKNVGEVVDKSWIRSIAELEEDIFEDFDASKSLDSILSGFYISPDSAHSKRRIYKDEVPYASDELILTLRVSKERHI